VDYVSVGQIHNNSDYIFFPVETTESLSFIKSSHSLKCIRIKHSENSHAHIKLLIDPEKAFEKIITNIGLHNFNRPAPYIWL